MKQKLVLNCKIFKKAKKKSSFLFLKNNKVLGGSNKRDKKMEQKN